MKKKILALTIILILALSVFAGCGFGNRGGSTGTGEEPFDGDYFDITKLKAAEGGSIVKSGTTVMFAGEFAGSETFAAVTDFIEADIPYGTIKVNGSLVSKELSSTVSFVIRFRYEQGSFTGYMSSALTSMSWDLLPLVISLWAKNIKITAYCFGFMKHPDSIAVGTEIVSIKDLSIVLI